MFRNRNEHGSIRLSGCNHVLTFARVNFCSASVRAHLVSRTRTHGSFEVFAQINTHMLVYIQDGRHPEAAKLTEFGILSARTFRIG